MNTIKPNWKLVQLDETDTWILKDIPEVKAIYGIYLIDTNCITYCASMQGSYYGIWLYNEFELKEEYQDISDERIDEIDNMIMEASAQVQDQNSYFSQSITEHAKQIEQADHKAIDWYLNQKISYEEVEQDISEYYNANRII